MLFLLFFTWIPLQILPSNIFCHLYVRSRKNFRDGGSKRTFAKKLKPNLEWNSDGTMSLAQLLHQCKWQINSVHIFSFFDPVRLCLTSFCDKGERLKKSQVKPISDVHCCITLAAFLRSAQIIKTSKSYFRILLAKRMAALDLSVKPCCLAADLYITVSIKGWEGRQRHIHSSEKQQISWWDLAACRSAEGAWCFCVVHVKMSWGLWRHRIAPCKLRVHSLACFSRASFSGSI